MRRFIFLFILCVGFIHAQSVSLIKDINTNTASSYPRLITAVGNGVYFTTTIQYREKYELWYYDVSTKDLTQVYEFENVQFPTFLSTSYNDMFIFILYNNNSAQWQGWVSDGFGAQSFYDGYISVFHDFNSTLYFASEYELYKSDLLSNELVYSFNEKPTYICSNSEFMYIMSRSPSSILWISDGTNKGTKEIMTFENGTIDQRFVCMDQYLYFFVDGPDSSRLWKSDGTEQNTKVLKSFNLDYNINYMVQSGEIIYFSARTEDEGVELWSTDGTVNQTKLLKDIRPGNRSSSPRDLTDVSGLLFFEAYNSDEELELWKSDGTDQGTIFLTKLADLASVRPKYMHNNNGFLYFDKIKNGTNRELWRSDGTEIGTILIKNIGEYRITNTNEIASVSNEIFFSAYTNSYADEVWKSDGTELGTDIIEDITDKTGDSRPENFISFNNQLYFQAYGNESKNIYKLHSKSLSMEKISVPENVTLAEFPLVVAGDFIYAIFNDSLLNRELWKVNGNTNESTFLRKSKIRSIASLNNQLFFTENDSNNAALLWQYNSDEDKTTLVKNISPGETNYIEDLVQSGGLLYFTPDYVRELWRTDGTPEGTFSVQENISPEFYYGTISGGDKFFFYTNNDALWVSDGSEAGTIELMSGNAGFNLRGDMEYFKGKLYFITRSKSTYKVHIFTSDGTPEGTTDFMTIDGGPGYELLSTDSKLFINIATETYGDELWKINLSNKSINLVKDIYAGSGSSRISEVISVGNMLYFNATNSENGSELWSSDGTADGTNLIEIEPGKNGSWPENLFHINDKIFFTAYKPAIGIELWMLNGIPTLIQDEILFPKEYKLSQNYPNPFNPVTHFSYYLPKSSEVVIRIFDISGKLIEESKLGRKAKGSYSFEFNGSNIASNIYFYQVEIDNVKRTKKMLLIK